MDAHSAEQAHATGDEDSAGNPQEYTTGYNFRAFFGLPQSTPAGPRNSAGISSRGTGTGTGALFTSSQVNNDGPIANSWLSRSKSAEHVSGLFSVDLPKPAIKTDLPGALDRIEMTQQLVYSNRLIRHCQSATAEGSTKESANESQESYVTESSASNDNGPQEWRPDETEHTWVKAQDPIQQRHLCGLLDKVVAEFIKDDRKESAMIAEVSILAPVLDRDTYRSLLNCFVATLRQEVYINVPLLQGLVQLIEGTSPGYLEHGDLVDTLTVLREGLERCHKPSTKQKSSLKEQPSSGDKLAFEHTLSQAHKASFEHLYQITIAMSRLLDVMVNSEVKNVDRTSVHQPLVAALSELEDITDPILQFQVHYALQASQYIPDDESTLQLVLRFSGGAVMLAFGVAGICKLDPANLFSSLDNLRQAAGEAYAVAKQLPEGWNAFQEGCSGAASSLLHGIRKGTKHEWYLTLLFARTYVRHGHLAKFNQTICGARCGDNQAFQLGVCQILGEIAMDPLWDRLTRQRAIEFLVALYWPATTSWRQHPAVKKWIVIILTQLSQLSDADVKDHACMLLQGLSYDGTTISADVYTAPLLLNSRLPPLERSPLLRRVQKILEDLEHELLRVRLEIRERRSEETIQRIYIPPMAKANLQARDDTVLSLMDKVQEFLDSEREVMLILGDSGAGKSTFNKHLEWQLLQSYSSGGRIPLFINLPALKNPFKKLMSEQLKDHNFSEEQILELKQHRQFVVICDGYDESQLDINLHTTNHFNRPGHWKVKMIITCRTQYLGPDYRNRFVPRQGDHYNQPVPHLFQEAVIAPFSELQIEEYVRQYVNLGRRIWSPEGYMDRLTTIPNLLSLVKNPFLLSIALEALPGVTGDTQDLSTIKITRVQLYDIFVDRWLHANQRRLEGNNALSSGDRIMLGQLVDSGFVARGVDYLQRLSAAIFEKQDGNPVVQYVPRLEKDTWKVTFFGADPEVKLVREACPLTRTGNQYRFVHRSLLEYFLSRAIYSSFSTDKDDVHPFADDEASTPPPINTNNPLFHRSLLNEPSIIQFLCDRVRLNSTFTQQLHAVINLSKTDVNADIAAANAITILVKVGVRFHGADLRGVKIPKADLTEGQFDSVNLQRADLRGAILARCWLRQANLSGANLEGVRFGELPYVVMDGAVRACAYSPNGKMLAVGLEYGGLTICDASNWTILHRLKEHRHRINSLAFSPDSKRIASGSDDKIVRVWDCISREVVWVLREHSKPVSSVAFSPCGMQVASASDDMTVNLWCTQNGRRLFTLKDHTDRVRSVKYSPQGRQLASGSVDGTIRFWDPETGEAGVMLSSQLGEIHSLAYSPDERRIVAGHENGDAQLWNAVTGEPGPILHGHTGLVTEVAFSPSGQCFASSSLDDTVRLWDTATGTLASILADHSIYVYCIAFSPDGLQLATGSQDRRVRLWEVNSGWSSVEVQGQNNPARRAAYSTNGNIVQSISDRTFRQWDSKTGAPGSFSFELPESLKTDSRALSQDAKQIAIGTRHGIIQLWDCQTDKAGLELKGHQNWVSKLAFSPCSRWIVSSSGDNSVRLWDLQNGGRRHVILYACKSLDETIGGFAFSLTGHQLATSTLSGDVRLFDLQSETMLVWKKIDNVDFQALAYSLDDPRLALGTSSSIYLWDLRKEEPSVVLGEPYSPIRRIAFSPCGQWIASSGIDKTVRLWHQETGSSGTENWSCVSTVRGFYGIVGDITWNPKAGLTEFVTACWDGSVRVWRVSKDADDDQSQGTVSVKLVWGDYIRLLCATDLNIKGATGLDSVQQKLLVQRGAASCFSIVVNRPEIEE